MQCGRVQRKIETDERFHTLVPQTFHHSLMPIGKLLPDGGNSSQFSKALFFDLKDTSQQLVVVSEDEIMIVESLPHLTMVLLLFRIHPMFPHDPIQASMHSRYKEITVPLIVAEFGKVLQFPKGIS